MNKHNSKYDASFTAGGLLINEFLALKPVLLGDDLKENLKLEVEENKRIGVSSKSARKRIVLEVTRRVNHAPNQFWDFFYNLDLKEQKLALLFLCFKTYPLIFDLHFEVSVKKYKTTGTLTDYDIQMRLDEIASSDDYVATWSDSTFKKINTQYRNALKESGLLSATNLNKSDVYNKSFWSYFKNVGDQLFLTACFIQN